MNNFDKQDRIDELTAQYTPRQLAGLLIDANRMLNDRREKVKALNKKIGFQRQGFLELEEDYAELENKRFAVKRFIEHVEQNVDEAWWLEEVMDKYFEENK